MIGAKIGISFNFYFPELAARKGRIFKRMFKRWAMKCMKYKLMLAKDKMIPRLEMAALARVNSSLLVAAHNMNISPLFTQAIRSRLKLLEFEITQRLSRSLQ